MRTQAGCWLGPGIWRPKNQAQECSSAKKNGHPSSRREGICPFFTFLFHAGCQRMVQSLPVLGQTSFMVYWNKCAHPFWKHPHRHTRSNTVSATWATCRPGKLTHNINHHRAGAKMRKWSDTGLPGKKKKTCIKKKHKHISNYKDENKMCWLNSLRAGHVSSDGHMARAWQVWNRGSIQVWWMDGWMDGWMGAKASPGSYNAYIVQHLDRHREV